MVLHEETDLTVPEAEEQPAQSQETHPENQSEEKSEEKPINWRKPVKKDRFIRSFFYLGMENLKKAYNEKKRIFLRLF